MKNGHLVKRLVVATLALGLLGANIKTMAEQAAESRRLSILSVKGENGFVIKGGTREIKATAGMPLGQGSKVKTGASSNLFLEADGDKVMKLDSQSVAEITGVSSKKLKITLKSGSLFFQVDRKLAEDEELTFDAAQTSMSIRGTAGLLSFKEKSLEFSLLEGSVDWTIGNETVAVEAGDKVVLKEVTDGLSLEKNGMNSIYELLEKKKLDWRELDDFGLETLLDQEGRMDLSVVRTGGRRRNGRRIPGGLECRSLWGRTVRMILPEQERPPVPMAVPPGQVLIAPPIPRAVPVLVGRTLLRQIVHHMNPPLG